MIDKNKIIDLIDSYVKEEDFSGAVLVKDGDEVVLEEARGYAHKGWKIKNTVDTMFDTASITKLFTSAAIFQLVDKGELSLDDFLFDIIDIGDNKLSKDIKIFHLLTHSSGIADDADEEAGEDYEEIWREKPSYMTRELEDFLPNFIHKEPNFKPGEDSRYNNCAYILLGMVIEKKTGMKYREYVQENIFDKLGMKNSKFISMDGINENAAEGYPGIYNENDELVGYRKNIYSYPPMGSPDGGAFTTVKDLDIFFRAIRNGDLFSKELTEKITSPQILSKEYTNINYHRGFGFEVFTNKDNSKVKMYEKDGCNPGVACVATYYPQQDITVNILSNHDCDVWDLAGDIRDILIPDFNS